MKWIPIDDYHWRRECGRYFICRSLCYARSPIGVWIFLASFKAHVDAVVEWLSDEPRNCFEDAVADCGAHLQSQRQQGTAASTSDQSEGEQDVDQEQGCDSVEVVQGP